MNKVTILFIQGLISLSFTNQLLSAETIVYDNLGPNNSYANFGNWIGYQSEIPRHVKSVGSIFIPNATGYLNSLTLGLRDDQEWRTDESFTVSIISNNNQTLGTEIWSQTFTTNLEYRGVFQVSDLGGPLLTDGEPYWLLVSADLTPPIYLACNNQNIYSYNVYIRFIPGSPDTTEYDYNLAFAMRVGVIPEPATLLLFGLGAAIVRNRRYGRWNKS